MTMGVRSRLAGIFRYFTEAESDGVSELMPKGSANRSILLRSNGGASIMLGGNFDRSGDTRLTTGLGAGGNLSAPGEVAYSVGAYSGAALDQHGS